ncbi:MAG TPA: hypothetical protein VN784_04535 [Candidatus Limnocylindrales bacterium]|nr:hypothetical protein [Candidatus Limnocylindrales bacterium]
MNVNHTDKVHIILPKAALSLVFDECDRFDHDETGGRIIGTFNENRGQLNLQVAGIIEPGPKAERSPVMLFQDGEYQERVFRKVEQEHPQIEHLGTWHTHHVNGLQTLSGGDITTYRKTVNHSNQNTPFFYALLVVRKDKTKDPLQRYAIKHFIFRRHHDDFYEIPSRQVEIVDTPLVWPLEDAAAVKHNEQAPKHPERAIQYSKYSMHSPANNLGAQPERVYDRDILAEYFQDVHPFTSAKLGFYWRGTIDLLDGSKVQVVLVEDATSDSPKYSLVLRNMPKSLEEVAELLAKQEFQSARVALITAERFCNRILYKQHIVGKPPKSKLRNLLCKFSLST